MSRRRNEQTRKESAAALQALVITVVRECTTETRVQFMNALRNRIHDMVNSPNAEEKRGGVIAIGAFGCPT